MWKNSSHLVLQNGHYKLEDPPTIWKLELGDFTITIQRPLLWNTEFLPQGSPNWVLVAPFIPFHSYCWLKSKDINDAKQEALDLVKNKLKEAVKVIDSL